MPMLALTVVLVGISVTTSSNAYATDVQVGRYSLVSAEPSEAQSDLLATTVTVQFPARIQTVGEALEYLLQRSGYRLADAPARAPEMREFLALQLPAVHQQLGPMALRLALSTLAGPTFQLVEDPRHRRVAFEPCTPARRSVRNTDAGAVREVTGDGK